jgi:hypothetical protein
LKAKHNLRDELPPLRSNALLCLSAKELVSVASIPWFTRRKKGVRIICLENGMAMQCAPFASLRNHSMREIVANTNPSSENQCVTPGIGRQCRNVISRSSHNLVSIHRQSAKGVLIVFYAKEHRNERMFFLQIVESHSNTENDELLQFRARVKMFFVTHHISDKHNDGVNRAGGIVSSIQVLRMKDKLIPLRFNDLFGALCKERITTRLEAEPPSHYEW